MSWVFHPTSECQFDYKGWLFSCSILFELTSWYSDPSLGLFCSIFLPTLHVFHHCMLYHVLYVFITALYSVCYHFSTTFCNILYPLGNWMVDFLSHQQLDLRERSQHLEVVPEICWCWKRLDIDLLASMFIHKLQRCVPGKGPNGLRNACSGDYGVSIPWYMPLHSLKILLHLLCGIEVEKVCSSNPWPQTVQVVLRLLMNTLWPFLGGIHLLSQLTLTPWQRPLYRGSLVLFP